MTWSDTLGVIVYDTTFILCFLLTTLAVAGSCASLVFQARLATRDVANWNVLILVGSYVAVGVISVSIALSRRLTGIKRMKTIPKAYVAVKPGDVPRPVAELIAEEYTRSCLVATSSRPTTAHHPGWGALGSKNEGIRFRQAILETVREVDHLARTFLPELPPYRPHRPMTEHLRKLDFVLLQDDSLRIKMYHELVEQARFDKDEPTELDLERCLEIVDQMKSILEFYIRAERSEMPPKPTLGPPPSRAYDQESTTTEPSMISPMSPYI